MPLNLYRRHSPMCQVHTLGLTPREVRHYRDCLCPIWIAGTTSTEKYPRQSLGTRDWAAAEAKLRAISATAADIAVHGPALSDCIHRFLDAHTTNIGHRALNHYRLTLGRLKEFAHARNKHFISDLTVDLVEDFKTYALGKFKSTTRHLFVTKLRFFLRESFRRGWLSEPIHEKVRTTPAVYEQKMPYTDVEVDAILSYAATVDGSRHRYATHPETFRLLLELMLETGMRVSDAIRYDPACCTKSEHLWIYRFTPVKQRKNEKPRQHEVFLTERLKLAIDTAAWFSPTHPFAYRAFDATNTIMEHSVYERMQMVGEHAGVTDCRPHRLRDTFAVHKLTCGMALEDVSRLLGHSSVAITEKYYSPWVIARRNRLEGLVAQTLVDPVRD